jgi:hypothetical protein
MVKKVEVVESQGVETIVSSRALPHKANPATAQPIILRDVRHDSRLLWIARGGGGSDIARDGHEHV